MNDGGVWIRSRFPIADNTATKFFVQIMQEVALTHRFLHDR